MVFWNDALKIEIQTEIFFFLHRKSKKHCVYAATTGTGTSMSCDPLQNFFSSSRMRMVSFSFIEVYAALGTSEEHSKKPGSLDAKWNLSPHIKINRYHYNVFFFYIYIYKIHYNMLCSIFLPCRAEGWVIFIKLWDVVVSYIFWDGCVVKELQVCLVHWEHSNLKRNMKNMLKINLWLYLICTMMKWK